MGSCHGNFSNKNGQLNKVIAKVKKSQDIEVIIKETQENYPTYNPFKNPILNRRLREQSTLTIQSNMLS